MSSLSGLKIKTNVVKRLFKEEQYYLKEVELLKNRLEEYTKKQDHDEYEARQMQRAIDETEQLLPDCRKRLLTASNELSALVNGFFGGPGDKNPDEILEATSLLQSIIIN
ncbi:hypothetical protein DSO57_1004227 [Entomophthora muscae]|uniref:Uncharacterized protein n=1 Tax=Entomophthora muscae TaxID=34485 RepID=A0ACC2RNE5_9FUNG|nr:hypothetical protein DSO57_1004227 [Entomophthora muscae]